ncbi:Cloroperoxidase [Exidia glandulosa HHB12029]|uniref:Cloroperoxidase n=1 Tax=Exidia glandulosa HHB12029 TaxID=1314781 RepID=A0A165MI23_EXIGL|nr:Cloroperoxidase [Exidia glandulosa HHB12029]
MRSSTVAAVLSVAGLVVAHSNPRDFHPPHMAELFGSWRPAGEDDSRSPCPLLNTLANEGILPHDGKNISIATLNQTLQDAIGLGTDLAGFLVAPLSAIVPEGGTLNLGDLLLHNFIEHDASLVHDDVAEGEKFASPKTNWTKVAEVALLSSDGMSLSTRDFAQARIIAEKRSRALDAQHQSVADGEPAFVLKVFGNPIEGDATASKISLVDFMFLFGLNRLPIGFTKKDTPVNLPTLQAGLARLMAEKAALSQQAST